MPTRPRGCARLCLPPLSAPRPGGGAKASGERAAIGERSWLGRGARSAPGSARTGAGPRRGVAKPRGPSYVPSPSAVPAPRSLPPSLAAPLSLPPPEHLSAPSRSTLGCARLPQALGPEPSVPSPPAGQVRPGSARLWPRPPLTWRSAQTKVRYLLKGRMLPSSCFPILVSVCPSVSCPLRTSCPPWLSALSPAAWSTSWHQTGHSLFRALRHSALRVVLHS